MEDIVPRILRVIRLGQDVDKEPIASADEALARAYEAARPFAGVLAEHPVDGIRFVATSATRECRGAVRNSKTTSRRSWACVAEVIPGTEESGFKLPRCQPASSIARSRPPIWWSISAEVPPNWCWEAAGVTHPSAQVQAAFSMNIGSVRLAERHLKNDPPTEGQIAEAVADIDAHIDEAFKIVPAGKTHTIIGVSGTVTTMTALAMGLTEYDHTAVDGARCTLEDAYAVDDRFLHMPREERLTYKTIHPGRVDVVGGGALVWEPCACQGV